ncbi:MAG: bacterio-opsin activator domain-containing protein [Halovenus sp.]
MSTVANLDTEFLRRLVFRSSVGILCLDTAGSAVFSNDVLEKQLGYESGELIDTHIRSLCREQHSTPFETIRDAVDSTLADPESLGSFRFVSADGETVPVALTVDSLGYDGDRYYVLRVWQRGVETADECAESGQLGTVLGEAHDTLATEEEPEAIAARTLDAATRLLRTSIGCIRLFNESRERLERVATTDTADDWVAAKPTFELDASMAGRAFRRGERVVDTDGISLPASAERPSDQRRLAGLHVPLGTRGTITVYVPRRPAQAADHLERLASVATTHLERVAQSTTANAATGPAEWLGRLVTDITDELNGAEPETTLLGRVCEQLTAVDRYSGAWYVEAEPESGWGAIEASAGDVAEAPAVVSEAVGTEGGNDAVETAIETDSINFVHEHRQVEPTVETRTAASSDSTETEALVPVSYGDQTYGVLVLALASERDPVSSRELQVLKDLLGLALYTMHTRRLLLSEDRLELEFEVTDRSCLAVGVSAATECYCEVEHSTTTRDGEYLMFLSAEGASSEDVSTAAEALDPVVETRIIEETADGCRLEVVKTDTAAEAMMDIGATVRTAAAEDGVGTLVVEAPISTDVREVVDAYTTESPGSRLVAKREIDGRPEPVDGSDQRLRTELTERQYSVLQAAYYAGYYDWPRESTAEDVASSLGLSSATLHQHLRKAERKMIEILNTDTDCCDSVPRR